MKNKVLCMLVTLLIVLTFSGCQLAYEELAQTKESDKLIGVFVTYEHLDLFDMENYLNDNISKFSKGGNMVINGADDKYNNRLYATLVEEELTAVESGEKQSMFSYVFEGLDGISMFASTITDPITGDSYSSTSSDNGISDSKYHLKSGDSEEEIELEGTIYVASGEISNAFYINPVYQSGDGKVYLQSGQGFMVSGDNNEGGVYTHTMVDSTSRTENKKTTQYTASIKLSFATINPTEKVVIYQIDSKNNTISNNEYLPSSVPQEIMPEKSCEYFIVESHKKALRGERQVDRQLFSKNDDEIYYFVKANNGVINKSYSTILWEENSKKTYTLNSFFEPLRY